MNVYVETNFVIQLVFVQEQHESCERIMSLCEARLASLVLPAFCIAEAYETLIRREKARTSIDRQLGDELLQLGRSEPYRDEIDAHRNVTELFARITEEQDQSLNAVLERISNIVYLIPIEASVVLDAASHRAMYGLKPQDSIVFSSVLHHLTLTNGVESCFITTDRDFGDPDIVDVLARQGCRTLFSFIDGCGYIEHRVNAD